MFDQQCQPNQIVLDVLGLDNAGLVGNSLFNFLDALGRQVHFEVAIAYYIDGEVGLESISFEVVCTELVNYITVLQSEVPVHPNQLGQLLPRLSLFIHFGNFYPLHYEGFVGLRVEYLLEI